MRARTPYRSRTRCLLFAGLAWLTAAAAPLRAAELRTERSSRSETAANGTTTTTEVETVLRDGQVIKRTTTTKITRPDGTVKKSVHSESFGEDPPSSAAPTAPAAALHPGSPSPSLASPSSADVKNQALAAHNRLRADVKVPPLAWDARLEKLAAEWAHHLCGGGKRFVGLQHRSRGDDSPGENLWAGTTSEPHRYPVADAVAGWANERRFFDEKSGRCRGGECRHYTQEVWRDTTHVGCASAVCSDGRMNATVWVCNYAPAGNVLGEKPY